MSKGRFEKTLRIGVRFHGTGFVLLDGRPLPKLAEDSLAELVLSPEQIVDEGARAMFTAERMVPFLEVGASVMIGVSRNMLEGSSSKGMVDPRDLRIVSKYLFVPVKLEGSLFLRIRGDQEARLSDCDCSLAAVEAPAVSLNHAFTIISETYETLRRSHSGNVFDRAYALDKDGKWRSLDDLRTAALAEPVARAARADPLRLVP
jgi:hypothetical protein